MDNIVDKVTNDINENKKADIMKTLNKKNREYFDCVEELLGKIANITEDIEITDPNNKKGLKKSKESKIYSTYEVSKRIQEMEGRSEKINQLFLEINVFIEKIRKDITGEELTYIYAYSIKDINGETTDIYYVENLTYEQIYDALFVSFQTSQSNLQGVLKQQVSKKRMLDKKEIAWEKEETKAVEVMNIFGNKPVYRKYAASHTNKNINEGQVYEAYRDALATRKEGIKLMVIDYDSNIKYKAKNNQLKVVYQYSNKKSKEESVVFQDKMNSENLFFPFLIASLRNKLVFYKGGDVGSQLIKLNQASIYSLQTLYIALLKIKYALTLGNNTDIKNALKHLFGEQVKNQNTDVIKKLDTKTAKAMEQIIEEQLQKNLT